MKDNTIELDPSYDQGYEDQGPDQPATKQGDGQFPYPREDTQNPLQLAQQMSSAEQEGVTGPVMEEDLNEPPLLEGQVARPELDRAGRRPEGGHEPRAADPQAHPRHRQVFLRGHRPHRPSHDRYFVRCAPHAGKGSLIDSSRRLASCTSDTSTGYAWWDASRSGR